jgi:hypothetical protein
MHLAFESLRSSKGINEQPHEDAARIKTKGTQIRRAMAIACGFLKKNPNPQVLSGQTVLRGGLILPRRLSVGCSGKSPPFQGVHWQRQTRGLKQCISN